MRGAAFGSSRGSRDHDGARDGRRNGLAARRRQPARRADRGGKRFEPQAVGKVQAKFGASGLLKDEIASGAKAEVFASANMEHPQALAAEKRSGPVVLFARNRLCALARPGLEVTPAALLDRMLDPQVKLGTSTPKADPSGDYAWEVFRKAEKLKPGARDAWRRRRCNSPAGPRARPRRRAARSMASLSRKAPPTSS